MDRMLSFISRKYSYTYIQKIGCLESVCVGRFIICLINFSVSKEALPLMFSMP